MYPYITYSKSSVTSENIAILHVDDEPGFSGLVKEFLEREDSSYSVRCATSVDDTFPILREEEIDCIVSDYDMPGEDGLEFLGRVRCEYPDVPFILFTGRGSEQIASDAISAGVTEYLQKEAGTDQYKILAIRIRNSVQSSRAETAINRTEECYHNLVGSAPIPICLLNKEGRIVYSNEATGTFLNADSNDDIQGKPFLEFLHAEEIENARQHFETVMADEESIPETEFRIKTIDNDFKSVTVSSAYGYYHGEEVAQIMVHGSVEILSN